MPIKFRRLIFYILLLAFFIISPIILALGTGWRFNYKTWELQKTGGIFLEGYPENSEIFINGKKREENPGLFQAGLLIDSLSPGEYKIEIWNKSNKIWEKNMLVKSSLVNGASIIIPQKELQAELIGISSSTPTEDILKLTRKDFVTLSADNQKLVVSRDTKSFFITDINSPKSSLNINTLLKQLGETGKIKNIWPHPYNNHGWIVNLSDGLIILDTRESKIEKIIKDKSDSVSVNDAEILWTSSSGTTSTISSYNILTKNKDVLFNNLPHILNQFIKINNKILGLDSSNNLYLIDTLKKETKLISKDISLFIPSPNNRKLLLKSGEEYLIYFLENTEKNEIKLASEITKLNLTKLSFVRFSWHKDSNHLIFQDGKNLIFMEAEDRNPQNKWTIVSDTKDFSYNSEENILYFTQNNSLYKLTVNN